LRDNLVDPGATRTRMRGDAFPAENPDTLKAPEAITEVFVELAEEAAAARARRSPCRDSSAHCNADERK
jgi:hypothetical protein